MLDPRVRRPADKEDLISKLAGDSSEAGFSSMRDLFVFAAALGKAESRHVPFTEAYGDAIRLELFQRDGTHELLINVIAVLEHPGDPEILREDRVAERIEIFEGYVNGGLELIQAHLNSHRLVREDDALNMLVQRRISARKSEQEVNLAQFADDLGL
ncbi:DNA phosphorothioation-associated protein 4 [Amycolatopsis vastitatis]|uniref:DNA phosphorothioation-associated protein 4 n=1 Tax=Amycolatopsis vastitatis TaxID=1905142 RepID=A0A229T207_9PSEU|nr:DNA phosphorothioation-associated protein 4 [Amycolatopsis vastitatis]OXM65306.1 DNA phosphorothioation-associated protein 4 [Amycolatopsis vastitatis]